MSHEDDMPDLSEDVDDQVCEGWQCDNGGDFIPKVSEAQSKTDPSAGTEVVSPVSIHCVANRVDADDSRAKKAELIEELFADITTQISYIGRALCRQVKKVRRRNSLAPDAVYVVHLKWPSMGVLREANINEGCMRIVPFDDLGQSYQAFLAPIVAQINPEKDYAVLQTCSFTHFDTADGAAQVTMARSGCSFDSDLQPTNANRYTLHTIMSCDQCLLPKGHTYKCSRCCLARYCSKRCQKIAWKSGHRGKCMGNAPR